MTAASLSLLKGGKKTAVEDELATKPAPPPTSEPEAATPADLELGEESIEIDPDALTEEQIDEVVSEYGLETPSNWKKLNLDQKRDWLKSQAEEDDGSAATPNPVIDAGPVIKDGDIIETVSPENPTQAEKVKEVHAKAEKKAKAEPKKKSEPEIKQGGGLVVPLAASGPTITEEASTKPAKAKKEKKTGTAVSTQVAKEGEIVQDVIVDLVHEVETLNEKDARSLVASLADHSEKTFFKLGGVLSVIQKNGWFQPYGTFRDFVEKEHGINYRRAVYWTSIYNKLVESKVPWDKVKSLGWTKLITLSDVLTEENVDEWVSIAKSQTVLQLTETVKAATAPDKQITDQTATSSTTTTKTFKVHEGQKETIEAALEKAKEAASTSVDTVALENICLDYIAAPTLSQRLKTAGIEAALKALGDAFPEANFSVELPE